VEEQSRRERSAPGLMHPVTYIELFEDRLIGPRAMVYLFSFYLDV